MTVNALHADGAAVPVLSPTADVDAVVVPLDGSSFAASALPVAGRMAATLDAGVHLLSVVRSATEVPDADADLVMAALDLPRRPASRTVAVRDDPAAALDDLVAQLPGSVICMASHGRGRSASVVGSVATSVLARDQAPLVLVCPLVDQRRPGHGVVVCVGGGPGSTRLVQCAVGWAHRLGHPTLVVTVTADVATSRRGRPGARRFGGGVDPDVNLADVVRPLRDRGHLIETRVIQDPAGPWRGLQGFLTRHPARLVVTGSHARTGVADAVHASMAAAIVRHSPCPVLVTKLRS